jgi:hypothetical protein
MGRTTRIAGATLALALLAPGALPAHAADDSTFTGQCGFDTVNQQTLNGDEWTGITFANVVLTSRTHGNAVRGTITCDLRVNGVPRVATSASGTGVVILAAPLTFTATDTDNVDVCVRVDFTSDSTPTVYRCRAATTLQMPPQQMLDLLSFVVDTVNAEIVPHVDPVACDAFQRLAPGSDPVAITPEGDVFLSGEPFWDCPPYVNPVPDPREPPQIEAIGAVPTGAGYDSANGGFITLVTPRPGVGLDGVDLGGTDEAAATCAYTILPNGTVGVTAAASAAGTSAPETTRVRCRLQDAVTGAVLYDETATGGGAFATLGATVASSTTRISVCADGTGTWADRESTTGFECRLG